MFFTAELNDMTLFNRVEYFDRYWLAERRGFSHEQIADSIDDFFRRDKLANSVRIGEKSYVEMAHRVDDYLRRSQYGFGMNVLDDSEGTVDTVRLISSFRNVGIGEFAMPYRHLGGARDQDRRTLDGILLIGAFFTGLSYAVALYKGDNAILSASVPGVGYGLIYWKMSRDSNKLVRDVRKKLPGIAKESEELVRRFA